MILDKTTLILNELQKMSRDIVFDITSHIYVHSSGMKLTSATALVNSIKQPFDTYRIAAASAKKQGVPRNKILAEWESKKVTATDQGNMFHDYAENSLQNKITDPFIDPTLIQQFEDFKHEYVSNGYLTKIGSEIIVGNKLLGIAGMIDQLFYNNQTSTLHIFDWKTNAKFRFTSEYKTKFKPPLNHMQECEFNNYSLQLSIYRYIIEESSKDLGSMFGDSYVVWFNVNNPSFTIVQLPYLRNEVKQIISKII